LWLVLLVVLISIGVVMRQVWLRGFAHRRNENYARQGCAPETCARSEDNPSHMRWQCQERCAQAVRRSERAVQAVTAESTRSELHAVVRRMAAELPNVRAVVALGDELVAQPADIAVVHRVDVRLDEAAQEFESFADAVVGLIDEVVRDPAVAPSSGTSRLRQRFPLLSPMSAIIRGERPAPGAGDPLRAAC